MAVQAHAPSRYMASCFGATEPVSPAPFVACTQASTVSATGTTMPITTTPAQNITAKSPEIRRSMERVGAWYGAMAIHTTYATVVTAMMTTPASASFSAKPPSSAALPRSSTRPAISVMPKARPAPKNIRGSAMLSHAGRAAIRYDDPATNGSTRPTMPPSTPNTFDTPG